MTFAVSLDGVTFTYPKAGRPALDSFSLSIPKGSFFALLGPNGAGKTTMLRLLCGRFLNYEGCVKVGGEFGKNNMLDPLCYGVLLENPGVYGKLTVEEYIEYFAGFYNMNLQSDKAAQERLQMLSQKLDIPSLKVKMAALSLGNRQKVQLLRALLPRPKLLILDEPVANLDPLARESVWKLIREWRLEEGGTAIVCSHILAELENQITDYAIICEGKVLKTGTIAETMEEDYLEYSISFKGNVREEQIVASLKNAGLEPQSIQRKKEVTLSEIYRKTVLE